MINKQSIKIMIPRTDMACIFLGNSFDEIVTFALFVVQDKMKAKKI